MKKTAKPATGTTAVDAFVAGLKHPLLAEIGAVRAMMRAIDTSITEEVKWNSPGFRTTESFATIFLRSTERLQIVFHLGAKVRPDTPDVKLPDPAGLVRWLAKDRCLVTLGKGAEIKANEAALRKIVRAWIAHV